MSPRVHEFEKKTYCPNRSTSKGKSLKKLAGTFSTDSHSFQFIQDPSRLEKLRLGGPSRLSITFGARAEGPETAPEIPPHGAPFRPKPPGAHFPLVNS